MDTYSSVTGRCAPAPLLRRFAHVAMLLGALSAFACSSDGGGGANTGGGTTSDAEPINDGAGGMADHAALDVSPDTKIDVSAMGTGGSAPDAEAGLGGGGEADATDSGAAPDRVEPDGGDGGGGSIVTDASDGGATDVSRDVPADRSPAPDAADASLDVPPDVPSTVDQIVPSDHVDAAVGGYLTVVAHPDDDILFFNPDLESAIRQGSASTTVYVTSGDASEEERGGWPAREAGILDAQAGMAGLTTQCLRVEQEMGGTCAWVCGPATFSGKSVVRCTLPTSASTTIFLRLPDLRIVANADVMTSLGYLWGPPIRNTTVASISRIDDPGTTYMRADLINVLAAIMSDRAVSHILTMDSTFAYGPRDFDHHDHVAVALFALTAAQQYGQVGDVRTYRGYTTAFSPDNFVSAPALTEKQRLMTVYGADCSGDYAAWCARQISYDSVTGTGRLQQSGQCIQSDGASAVSLTACTGDADQQWVVGADASIIGVNGLCLATDGQALGVAACNHSASQRWTLFVNGQLRGLNGTCMTSAASDVGPDVCQGDIHIDDDGGSTGPDATQTWFF